MSEKNIISLHRKEFKLHQMFQKTCLFQPCLKCNQDRLIKLLFQSVWKEKDQVYRRQKIDRAGMKQIWKRKTGIKINELKWKYIGRKELKQISNRKDLSADWNGNN